MRLLAPAVLVSLLALVAAVYASSPADRIGGFPAQPLVSGEFLSGTLWEKPVSTSVGSNTGHAPAAGSRVDLYDSFIVVTDAEGIAEVSLHGSYTNLRFKPYRP